MTNFHTYTTCCVDFLNTIILVSDCKFVKLICYVICSS
jgi:hypothetical protein